MNNNLSLVRYENEGIELFVDTTTGESFATERGYARLSGKTQQSINKRTNTLEPTTKARLYKAEIQTAQGLRTNNLITEDLICEWLPNDNPQMAAQLLKLGVRVFLHKLAGFEVSTTAVKPLDALEVATSAIDLIFANTSIKKELIAGIKLNIAQKRLPEFAEDLEQSRQLLINSTAQPYELLTPTQIGERLGLSAIAVNKLLVSKGFQVKNPQKKSKKDPSYLPTGKGLEFSDLTLATGKGDSNSSYQQLRWYSSILSQI